jgi:hypothetical protein
MQEDHVRCGVNSIHMRYPPRLTQFYRALSFIAVLHPYSTECLIVVQTCMVQWLQYGHFVGCVGEYMDFA